MTIIQLSEHMSNQQSDSVILSTSASIMSQLPGIAFTKTAQSIYVGANSYSAYLYGFNDSEQIIGLNDFELKSAVVESAEDFINEDKKVFDSGKAYSSLHVNNYLNGERHIFFTQKIPLKNFQGKIIGLNCIANEITHPGTIKIIMNLLHSNKFFINKNKKFNLKVDDNAVFSNLNSFENEILYLFNIGFSQKDISFLQNLPSKKISEYLELIRLKLKCNSYQDLVELCLNANYHLIIPKTFLDKIFSQLVFAFRKTIALNSNELIENETDPYRFKDKQRNLFLKLSRQQSQCLHYLLQGKSAKEIALELNLSHRTVEHYISQIRTKNGYSSTKQLLTNILF